MGTAILKIKIMPKQGTDLKNLQEELKERVEKVKGKVNSVEEEEIAFGLKALILTIAWPEEQGTEKVESSIKSIKSVSSLDIIDYRRAFG